jgi:hypothetical protein
LGGSAQPQGRLVGLCDTMCPLFELHEREYRGGGDLPIFESVRSMPLLMHRRTHSPQAFFGLCAHRQLARPMERTHTLGTRFCLCAHRQLARPMERTHTLGTRFCLCAHGRAVRHGVTTYVYG